MCTCETRGVKTKVVRKNTNQNSLSFRAAGALPQTSVIFLLFSIYMKIADFPKFFHIHGDFSYILRFFPHFFHISLLNSRCYLKYLKSSTSQVGIWNQGIIMTRVCMFGITDFLMIFSHYNWSIVKSQLFGIQNTSCFVSEVFSLC